MITDDELLAACRSAGEPGSESHRAACRLYRKAVIEWQAAREEKPAVADWREERARQAAVGQIVAVLARALEAAGRQAARRRAVTARCGTSAGWKRHRREGSETCMACRRYERDRARARRRAAAPGALREAA